jgi:hypothetical protein
MGSVTDTPFAQEDEELANWNLTEVDQILLRQSDSEYEPHTWDELKSIVGKFPRFQNEGT